VGSPCAIVPLLGGGRGHTRPPVTLCLCLCLFYFILHLGIFDKYQFYPLSGKATVTTGGSRSPSLGGYSWSGKEG